VQLAQCHESWRGYIGAGHFANQKKPAPEAGFFTDIATNAWLTRNTQFLRLVEPPSMSLFSRA
jgi:hypothetical protein